MRKTRKGGVIVKNVVSFPPYRKCHQYDCVPSAFYELGLEAGTNNIKNPEADFMSRSFKDGITTEEILKILDTAYKVKHHTQVYNAENSGDLRDLSVRLANNEAILAGISDPGKEHAFIIFKDSDGELMAREPQLNRTYKFTEYIRLFNVKEFDVIYTEGGERVDRYSHQITPNMIQSLEKKLPWYEYTPNPHSAWHIASTTEPASGRLERGKKNSKPDSNRNGRRMTPYGGTRKRFRK